MQTLLVKIGTLLFLLFGVSFFSGFSACGLKGKDCITSTDCSVGTSCNAGICSTQTSEPQTSEPQTSKPQTSEPQNQQEVDYGQIMTAESNEPNMSIGGNIQLLWSNPSGSPDRSFITTNGTGAKGKIELMLDSTPPNGALIHDLYAIAYILLTNPQKPLPEGEVKGLREADIFQSLEGISEKFVVVYRADKSINEYIKKAPGMEYLKKFPTGYSCGKVASKNQHGFDTLEPCGWSELRILDQGEFRINWH